MSKNIQNFYKATLSLDWSIGTGNFYVSIKPTITDGWLVISPNNSTIREIIKYTSTGTDANGDYVVVSQRGVGGTTEQIHTVGEPIRMNVTAEYWKYMGDAIDSIVAAGVPNADTTTFGGVQEATAAQIDAGTQTGSTGAELFINPKLLNDAHNIPFVAPGTSGNTLESNGTDWIAVSAKNIPFITQDLGVTATSNPVASILHQLCSSLNGNELFISYDVSNSGNLSIYRFERNTISGSYNMTHATSLNTIGGNGGRGLFVVGNYLYVSCFISGSNAIRRYDKATLANVTTITFSGTSVVGMGFSDFSNNIYIGVGGDKYTKFTISGTVATNNGDTTFTSSVATACAVYDGSHVYITDNLGTTTMNIRKYLITGGAVISTQTIVANQNSWYNSYTAIIFNGGTNIIGLGWLFNSCSPSAITGSLLHLTAL